MKGGILRGHATGNVVNMAGELESQTLNHSNSNLTGNVLLYRSCKAASPAMTMRHQVTPELEPILSSLGGRYSPIESKFLLNFRNLQY
jgi:hypothetical protein